MTGMDHLFVGIDLGTSGCRAVGIDADGAVRCRAERPLAPPRRAGDTSEQDPELWWEAVRQVLAELAAEAPAAIAAIAVDGTSATVLACDRQLRPLGPALMYDDRSSRPEAEAVAAAAPADSPAQGTGASLAKAVRLYHGHAGVARLLHQADWVSARLRGGPVVSDEHHALKLGYDPVARRWPDWIAQLLPPEALPPVRPPGVDLGPVDEALRQALHLTAPVRVVSGTTDSTAAFLATGARQPGDAVTSLGSTLVVKVLAERPVFAPRHGVYSHRLGDLWLVGGASNSGGAALLAHFSRQQLTELSARLDPARPTGLDYYPLPRPGERFPIADPDLPPRLQPRPADPARFLQGMLEGIARIEADGYRLLAELGAPYPTSVRTVGGGAVNTAWTAIRARLLGVPMLAPEHTDAAYGAALLARGAHSDGLKSTTQRRRDAKDAE